MLLRACPDKLPLVCIWLYAMAVWGCGLPASWQDLHGQAPPLLGDDDPQLDNTRGFCKRALLRELDASSAALFDPQAKLWNPRCSVSCFCVGSVCSSRSLQLVAGATSHMLFAEATLQPAPDLVFCSHVEARSNERLP